jgi:hypothetical protein
MIHHLVIALGLFLGGFFAGLATALLLGCCRCAARVLPTGNDEAFTRKS